jgi:hypothetical protein
MELLGDRNLDSEIVRDPRVGLVSASDTDAVGFGVDIGELGGTAVPP